MLRVLRRAVWVAVCVAATVTCGGAYEEATMNGSDGSAPIVGSDSSAALDTSSNVDPSSHDASSNTDASSGNDASYNIDASSKGDAATKADAGYDAGYDAGPPLDASPPSDAGTLSAWEQLTFTEVNAFGTCTGARYVAYNSLYKVYVGAIRCGSSMQYKLYLSTTKGGKYYEIADGANGGEDHCELVQPTFTKNDFATCATCSIGASAGGSGDAPTVGVWTRSYPGENFTFHTKWPQFNYYSPTWYKCGVAIP